MVSVYKRRPFKARNAEEYDSGSIINLFVTPINDLRDCFEFENCIIKGKMGSGKTMLLKANLALYLSSMVPSILSGTELIMPVYLKLSDFQHIRNPEQIYNSIIVRIIEEISSSYLNLIDSHKLAQLHNGVLNFASSLFEEFRFTKVLDELSKLNAHEYIEKVSHSLGLNAKLKHPFIETAANYKNERIVEVKTKKQPGILDVCNAYDILLKKYNGKILLLIDEVGSLDKSFFSKTDGVSFFEVLMNQLRTVEYLRTKIAIYPHSLSDMLIETRYGNLVLLDENILLLESYKRFRCKTIDLIHKYINANSGHPLNVSDLFDINLEDILCSDCLEQLINASGGNTRRLIKLLDMAMKVAFEDHLGAGKISDTHVIATLEKESQEMTHLYYDSDLELLHKIALACKKRKTFKFKFPYKSPVLTKYTNKSEEHNILSIAETGVGGRGNTYKFDYSYCFTNEIPTHHILGTDKIDRSRSRKLGNWANNIAQISEEIIEQAGLPGKINGEIQFLANGAGFIKGNDGNDYYLVFEEIINPEKYKVLEVGKVVRFFPVIKSDSRMAVSVEVL